MATKTASRKRTAKPIKGAKPKVEQEAINESDITVVFNTVTQDEQLILDEVAIQTKVDSIVERMVRDGVHAEEEVRSEVQSIASLPDRRVGAKALVDAAANILCEPYVAHGLNHTGRHASREERIAYAEYLATTLVASVRSAAF